MIGPPPVISAGTLDEPALSGGAMVSNSLKIYVFRYGATALRALTVDAMGDNLPPQNGPGDLHLEDIGSLDGETGGPRFELFNITLAAIKTHDLILTYGGAEFLRSPAALEQNLEPAT
jgi:hypothetical protein